MIIRDAKLLIEAIQSGIREAELDGNSNPEVRICVHSEEVKIEDVAYYEAEDAEPDRIVITGEFGH